MTNVREITLIISGFLEGKKSLKETNERLSKAFKLKKIKLGFREIEEIEDILTDAFSGIMTTTHSLVKIKKMLVRFKN